MQNDLHLFNRQTTQHNKQTESLKLNHAARTLTRLHSNRSLRNNVQMSVQYEAYSPPLNSLAQRLVVEH